MEEKVNENVIKEKVVVESTPPVVEVVKPVEKKHEGFPKIVAVVLFIIILAMAGFMVWHFLTTNHEVKECETPKDENETVVDKTESEVDEVEAVRSVVANVREVVQNIVGKSVPLIGIYDSYEFAYKPEGFETGVPLEHTFGFDINYEQVTRDSQAYNSLDAITSGNRLFDAISGVLVGQGFVNTGESYTTASAGVPPVVFMNETTGVVCGVLNWPTFSCAYKSWYNEENAKLSNELLKVYNAENKDDMTANYVAANVDAIKPGATESYQTITVGMTASKAMFYRESADAEWHFVTRGQYVPCSAFSTEEAKKAFAGTVCQEGSGSSVVQL